MTVKVLLRVSELFKLTLKQLYPV